MTGIFGTIPKRLLFTDDSLKFKASRPVKLIFSNPDATEHNFLCTFPGHRTIMKDFLVVGE